MSPPVTGRGEAAPEAAALALTGLPGATPARIHHLLRRWPDPADAWRAVVDGRAAATGCTLGPAHPNALEAAGALLERRQTAVLVPHRPGYPIDPELPGRPALLLAEGARADLLARPRVAVVGSRAATPHGLADAFALGAFLAGEGICVVSGMAIGVDGAAHEGALSVSSEGGPVGVLATGLDVVYPRRHRALFGRVRAAGLLLTEHGYGALPLGGHFPVRNRIIAGLADCVVVVEATLTGGSRITAERALDYGRPVLAVPGSRRNPVAAGCNALLADGAQPLLDPSDILIALGMTQGARRGWSAPTPRRSLSPSATTVHRALAGEAAHPDDLSARTGLAPEQLALALDELVDAGRAERSRGLVWPA